MKVYCMNCRKDLNKWNVGRDGRLVICDDCTIRLVSGVADSVLKETIRKPVKRKTNILRLKKL